MPYRLLVFFFVLLPFHIVAQIYEISSAKVTFHSSTAQEQIHASSEGLAGIIDMSKKKFAFKISLASFMGFNNSVQREHFNENYMESSIFPDATFTGKIVEDVDLSQDGDYRVRAKGKLKIHGIEQERIVYSRVLVADHKISVNATFTVPLADHNIKIPRVVTDKLATNINVSLTATFVPR